MFENEIWLEKIEEVSKYWGEMMPTMTMEECGELIQAISKMIRETNKPPTETTMYPRVKKNLIEEMGDVMISIHALMVYYCVEPSAINEYIDKKLNRRYD